MKGFAIIHCLISAKEKDLMKNFKHLLLGLLTISLASCANGGSAGKDYMGAPCAGLINFL